MERERVPVTASVLFIMLQPPVYLNEVGYELRAGHERTEPWRFVGCAAAADNVAPFFR